jgi:hypothetical protein
MEDPAAESVHRQTDDHIRMPSERHNFPARGHHLSRFRHAARDGARADNNLGHLPLESISVTIARNLDGLLKERQFQMAEVG